MTNFKNVYEIAESLNDTIVSKTSWKNNVIQAYGDTEYGVIISLLDYCNSCHVYEDHADAPVISIQHLYENENEYRLSVAVVNED